MLSCNPMTPTMFPATNSASSRWYCQLAEPVSVTNPLSDLDVDAVWNQPVERQRLEHRRAKVGVLATIFGHDSHVQLVVDLHDPEDTFGCFDGFTPLPEAADRAAQRDHAVVCGGCRLDGRGRPRLSRVVAVALRSRRSCARRTLRTFEGSARCPICSSHWITWRCTASALSNVPSRVQCPGWTSTGRVCQTA